MKNECQICGRKEWEDGIHLTITTIAGKIGEANKTSISCQNGQHKKVI